MKKIFLFIIFITANISLGELNVYDYIKKISQSFKPLPITYSYQAKEDIGYEDIMNILLGKKRNGNGLLKSEDALLIMTWDGDYVFFRYISPNNIFAIPVPRKIMVEKLSEIEDSYGRVWIILVNPKLGQKATPPAKFASKMNRDYLRIELSMPLYLRFFYWIIYLV